MKIKEKGYKRNKTQFKIVCDDELYEILYDAVGGSDLNRNDWVLQAIEEKLRREHWIA